MPAGVTDRKSVPLRHQLPLQLCVFLLLYPMLEQYPRGSCGLSTRLPPRSAETSPGRLPRIAEVVMICTVNCRLEQCRHRPVCAAGGQRAGRAHRQAAGRRCPIQCARHAPPGGAKPGCDTGQLASWACRHGARCRRLPRDAATFGRAHGRGRLGQSTLALPASRRNTLHFGAGARLYTSDCSKVHSWRWC